MSAPVPPTVSLPCRSRHFPKAVAHVLLCPPPDNPMLSSLRGILYNQRPEGWFLLEGLSLKLSHAAGNKNLFIRQRYQELLHLERRWQGETLGHIYIYYLSLYMVTLPLPRFRLLSIHEPPSPKSLGPIAPLRAKLPWPAAQALGPRASPGWKHMSSCPCPPPPPGLGSSLPSGASPPRVSKLCGLCQ